MYRRPSLFVLIIVALASFGFVFRMITDPTGLMGQLLFFVVTAAIIFGVFKLFLQKRMGPQARSYQKAAKQSKMRYQQKSPKFSIASKSRITEKKGKKKGIRPLVSKRNKDHNLTVIEGNKGKKKNRALF